MTALAAGLLFAVDPASSSLYPPCPSRALTGLYCPGCGTLRALHALAHGRVGAAFALNPLMVLSIPLVVALLVGRGRWQRHPSLPWLVFAVVVVYAVLRNIPVHPFTLLAPL